MRTKQMSTENPQNLGEALQAATEKKRKSRAKKYKGVRYVPGQSCIQLKKEHDYQSRTSKSGNKYQVCKKCGSSRMLKKEEKSE